MTWIKIFFLFFKFKSLLVKQNISPFLLVRNGRDLGRLSTLKGGGYSGGVSRQQVVEFILLVFFLTSALLPSHPPSLPR